MARERLESGHDEFGDPVVARLLELQGASEQVLPRPGIARQVAARLDERRVKSQLALALTAAALAASVSLAFWWDASSRLRVATVASAVDDAEGFEP